MTFWLIGTGLALSLFGWGRMSKRRLLGWGLIGVGLLLVAVGIASADRFLGPESWYNHSPVRELAMFLLMAFGMMSRVLSLAIEERRAARAKISRKIAAPRIRLDGWDLLYPFMSATLCFGALLETIGDAPVSVTTVVLAFQNGFFWQTILSRSTPA